MSVNMKTRCYWLNHIIILLVVSMTPVYASSWFGSDKNYHDNEKHKNGIPAVLAQLELVTSKLNQIEDQLQHQQSQLAELQEETIPCTLERYREGQCGEGNSPFDLVVSICGNMSGEVSIGGKYGLDSRTSAQVGVGWKEVIDADYTTEIGMPGVLLVPGPIPLPVILPSEVAAGADGSVGLGMDGCIEGVKIPVGKNIDHNRVIALLEKLEQGAGQIQTSLLDALDNQYSTEAIALALRAKESMANKAFDGNPLSVFTSTEVQELAGLLPTGQRINTLISSPEEMIPDLDPLNANLCNSLDESTKFGEKMSKVCSFIGSDLPEHELVTGAFEKIDRVEEMVIDLPETIKSTVSEIIPNATAVPAKVGNAFCRYTGLFCP